MGVIERGPLAALFCSLKGWVLELYGRWPCNGRWKSSASKAGRVSTQMSSADGVTNVLLI